jgi:hypothetical protein
MARPEAQIGGKFALIPSRHWRHSFLDAVPELRTKLRRGFRRCFAFWIKRLAGEPLCRKGNAELLRLPFGGS